MTSHAGGKAQQSVDLRCEKCGQKTHVNQGQRIPKCPGCGCETFSDRQ